MRKAEAIARLLDDPDLRSFLGCGSPEEGVCISVR